MAVFEEEDLLKNGIDWAILKNGWVSLYWKNECLNSDLEWFKNKQYSIIEFDCASWKNTKIMKNQIYTKLDFPDGDLIYDDFNFDAFNDWLSDLEIGLLY